ncbi:hypothetical protein C3F00_021880 [Pseudomonas sp. MWU13-2860]|nr:hypothetical protein C3F00_021880 [Pseudomonas sp. MWU13-2860]
MTSARPCRSRLAGDGGRMSVARLKGLIAGKPAPTRDRAQKKISCKPKRQPRPTHPLRRHQPVAQALARQPRRPRRRS